MTEFFDGKAFAAEKEKELVEKVRKLRNSGVIPKLISIIIGNDTQSRLYQDLKKKAAERIGAELEIRILPEAVNLEELKKSIESIGNDINVHGVMIQLPFPKNISQNDRDEILNSINPKKDVDGLREESEFIAPVVKAVENAIPENSNELKTTILGAGGFEGRKIIKRLKQLGFKDLYALDKSATDQGEILKNSDLVISATGEPDLVKPEMVKKGVILIDVGSPRGDISKDCYTKASFVTPVPGGIGPATIILLMENLIFASNCG